eukprot:2837962-Amphidinium_carterae.1
MSLPFASDCHSVTVSVRSVVRGPSFGLTLLEREYRKSHVAFGAAMPNLSSAAHALPPHL